MFATQFTLTDRSEVADWSRLAYHR